MTSLFRIIKFAFQDIFRNLSLSIMTILVLVLMLLSVNTFVTIDVITTKATSIIKDQIDLSIYFAHTVSESQIKEVEEFVHSFPEVQSTTFVSADQVLEQFREQHKDNQNILASLDEIEENPLGPTLIVRTLDPTDFQIIVNALSVPEYEQIIDAKTFGDTEVAIDRIQNITSQVETFSLILSVFFGIVAFIVVFNTIRIAIYTQRTEIGIKKLVGATNWFVRGPYVIEAFIFTLFSMMIMVIILYFVITFLSPYLDVVLGTQNFLTNYFQSNIIVLLWSQIVAVFALCLFSSLLATRKYLKK